jgi:Leucine-rich repeat (LRR) protein
VYSAAVNALRAIFGDWNQTPNIAINLPGWTSNTSVTPCFNDAWKGVLCVRYPQDPGNYNYQQSIVVGLILDDASIVGTLSPAIGNLTNLVILSLTGNPGLTGPIPAEINLDRFLEILDLHDNNFTGTIPALNPWGLQQLDLSGNQLTGPIPNFGSMTWLQTLKLSGNQLSGPSPVFLNSSTSNGLANLTRLTTLDLSNNLMLSGSPPDLTTMPTLQYL